jgi:hypothetical protein
MTEANDNLSDIRRAEQAQAMTLAHWMARKVIKAQWQAQGIRWMYVEPGELHRAASVYLARHPELGTQCTACGSATTAWSMFVIGPMTAFRSSARTAPSPRNSASSRKRCRTARCVVRGPRTEIYFHGRWREQPDCDAGTRYRRGGDLMGPCWADGGEFKWVHGIAIDSKGNLYTAEVGFGRRTQKFKRIN